MKRKKPLNSDYRYAMIRVWNIFLKITGKEEIRDITFNDVGRYFNHIQDEAEFKLEKRKIKRPDLYINSKFSAVHDVLSKIRPTQAYKRDINNLLDNIGQLLRIDEDPVRGKAITQKQWDILYKHSENNLFIRCGLLLGLNCAMTWGDIIDLRSDAFNFKQSTYLGTRSKNETQNCALLFPETVQFMKQYIEENPIPRDSGIFYYKNVTRKSMLDGIVEVFREWKKELSQAKFESVENITHKHLRKSLILQHDMIKSPVVYMRGFY